MQFALISTNWCRLKNIPKKKTFSIACNTNRNPFSIAPLFVDKVLNNGSNERLTHQIIIIFKF